MIHYGMMGSTKNGEYARTIEMLRQMTTKKNKASDVLVDVERVLYFLHDSQYDRKDLLEMAKLITDNKKKGINI